MKNQVIDLIGLIETTKAQLNIVSSLDIVYNHNYPYTFHVELTRMLQTKLQYSTK